MTVKINKSIRITQIRSSIGCLPKHKATLFGLGLLHINHSVVRKCTLEIQGMINVVSHLVKFKELK